MHMRRQIALAAVFVLIVLATGLPARQATPAAQQRPPVFRTDTNFVQVDAYPMKDGRIVTNLEKGDFEILEDGKPQKIESFELVKMEPFTPDGEKRDPNTVGEANEQAADPKNRVFVVYLDTPHVSIAGAHSTRAPLVQALNRIMAPNDLFAVVTPDTRPSGMSFGRKLTTTEDMLTRYWPWGVRDSILRTPQEAALEPCTIDPKTGQDMGVDDDGISRKMIDVLIDRQREDRVFAHLEDTIDYLGVIRETRKSFVIFTEGWRLFRPDPALTAPLQRVQRYIDSVPRIGIAPGGRITADSTKDGFSVAGCVSEVNRLSLIEDQSRFRQIIERARRANVVFYPVNPAGLEVFDIPINQSGANANLKEQMDRVRFRADHMLEVAENTGGLAVVNTNGLSAGLDRIANQLSAYYVLGYYSSNSKFDGRYRQIDVKLKVPGVSVTARRGYRAPTEAEMAGRSAPKVVAAPGADAAAAELAEALGNLARIRTSADLYGWGVQTSASELTVFAEVASPLAEAGKWMDGGDLQVVLTTPAGEQVASGRGRLDRISRGASARVPLPAGATGPWNAQLRVRNGADMIETSVAISRSVPPSATVLLSGALLYRATPGMNSALHPVADFLFRRTERVHVEWMLGAPLETREARLLDRAGNPLPLQVTLGEKPGVLVADVNLAPLAPGDYILELNVTGAGGSAKTKIAIRVGS